MSDLTKVVQKLTETNAKLAILERQNNESGSVKELIKAALPEILNDNKNVKFQDKEEAKRDKTSGNQFGKAQKPRKQISEEIITQDQILLDIASNKEARDETQLLINEQQLELDEKILKLTTLTGPPDPMDLQQVQLLQQTLETNEDIRAQLTEDQKLLFDSRPTPAKIEEDEKDKVKSLAAALSKSSIGKGILGIGKSIGGFIGGLASTAKGGALMFLKGIIAASALGLIIMFLKSDVFKEFLSKKNLRRLFKFFGDMKVYFDQAYKFIADPNNRKSIAYAIAAAAIADFVFSSLGGVILSLGLLFGLKGIFGKKAIADTTASIASANKGGGFKNFLKFAKGTVFLGLIVGLVTSMFGFITGAMESYMKGNSFFSIIASGLAGILKVFGFTNAAKKLKDFLDPSDAAKIATAEKKLALLEEESDVSGVNNVTEIDALKKKISMLKKEKVTNDAEKTVKKKLREDTDAYIKAKSKAISDAMLAAAADKKSNAEINEAGKDAELEFIKINGVLPSFEPGVKARQALDLKKINQDVQSAKDADARRLTALTKGVERSRGKLAIGVDGFGQSILIPSNKMNGIDGPSISVMNSKGGDTTNIINKKTVVKAAKNLSFHEQYINSG